VGFDETFLARYLCDGRPRTIEACRGTLAAWERCRPVRSVPFTDLDSLRLLAFRARAAACMKGTTASQHLRHGRPSSTPPDRLDRARGLASAGKIRSLPMDCGAFATAMPRWAGCRKRRRHPPLRGTRK
jgi:hypothetical protein